MKKIMKIFSRILFYSVLVIILIAVFFPIYWLIISSLKPISKIWAFPPTFIPETIDAYKRILTFSGFLQGYINSLIIAFSTVFLSMIIGLLTTFALTRKMPEKSTYNILISLLVGQSIPPIVSVIPYFMLLFKLKLTDTILGLILVYTTFNVSFVVWLLYGFITDLPIEIEEAAMIDGCSRIRAFFSITLYMALPGLVVTAILTFFNSWSELLFATVLTSRTAKTAPIVITTLMSQWTSGWDMILAGGVLVMLPTIIISMIARKYLVSGLTLGAVKG